MIPEVEEAREQVADICRRHNGLRLEIFGSATGPNFDPISSDLDFLVEFGPFVPVEYSEHYFAMLEELVELFHRHLVIAPAVTNPYFLEGIKHSRELMYAE
jgi:predicted nucleotidyltransferase